MEYYWYYKYYCSTGSVHNTGAFVQIDISYIERVRTGTSVLRTQAFVLYTSTVLWYIHDDDREYKYSYKGNLELSRCSSIFLVQAKVADF